ncbi:MAG TPA: thiamine pyrophosphate-binding protein, partial [Bacteroidia bacterium]|nr:thiamine pyrophosphate-binding protein [Bacteroidia bacterium]
MNVCEALLNVLTDYGVKYIFGIPGDSINELIEAIRKQDKIKFIHVMHEEAGAFAASAQAKLTGE